MNEAETLKPSTVDGLANDRNGEHPLRHSRFFLKHETKISRSLIGLSAIMKIDGRSNHV
jgi:hypothetical protein